MAQLQKVSVSALAFLGRRESRHDEYQCRATRNDNHDALAPALVGGGGRGRIGGRGGERVAVVVVVVVVVAVFPVFFM